ncbi:MAG: hypothetical protein LGB07_04830 [Sulfurovum sp.]|nr:hypothetical protein [Sulfurovum sp.]MCB4744955.1 hypothetical protein [Sulfurovum sp.]MCB4746049.1 hypothetical protein [Sulfurovum sp.]MCB4748356.1 hypothetical protein [Sulfurovum sp.]MCB4749285.1 hypothetical protein [Sulfurovum sp.]
MRKKITQIQEHIANDPKLKQAVGRIKPERTIWGVLGVVLFFFVPELVTYIWQSELIEWAHLHSIIEPLSQIRWMYTALESMFKDGVSWLNITVGILLLVWMLKSK